jgi:ssDNA-binding Zn-finger/Zn-ribbon topoisomerase 1
MPKTISQKKNTDTTQKGLAFIKEVAKYFMDFLETDFHKRKNPKRNIQFRSKNNLLIGLNLGKYPSFNTLAWKAINHGFDKNVLTAIEKGVHRTNIPKNLLDLIKLQSEKISQKQINKILNNASDEIEKGSILYKKDFDQAYITSLENISKIIKDNLVLPFVSNLDTPLENLDLGDENSIYLMEEELTSVLVALLENKISEILKHLLSKEKINISKELEPVFSLEEIKNTVYAFFESFKVTDLFLEVFEIERNRNILDKQEFYLYFCDITFNKTKYPIFYIPFVVARQGDILSIEFDSQVYINKKALEYITQEYNEEKGKKGNLKTISERIIYLAQHQDDFRDVVSGILNEIVNFFELDSSIDINNPTQQISKSFWTRISNTCYIALFDKSDEALVNDYEDILQKINEGDSVLATAFNKLIEDFIQKNPDPFNPEIEEEWDNTETSDRLVFTSPIPLNSEQLQILAAVRKDNCKYITVEGPPGTGKSHTITAVVFDAILKNQSVLVLSDKKEALDVVEDKITDTMNKVRYDKNFQNPILRLGKTGSTYSQILSTTSIENIKTHYRAIKKDYENLENNIKKVANTLKEDLEAEILAYGEIDIKEIHELFDLENYFKEKESVVDINEVLHQPESAIELEEFRKIFKNLRDKFLENNSKSLELFGLSLKSFDDIAKFQKFISFLIALQENLHKLKEVFGEKIVLLSSFKELSDEDLEKLSKFITDYGNLRNWLFGYFLKKKQVEKLNLKFKKSFPYSQFNQPHESISKLKEVLEILDYIKNLKQEIKYPSILKFDCIKTIHRLLDNKELTQSVQETITLGEDIKYLKSNLSKYPKTIKNLKIDLMDFSTLCNNELVKMSSMNFDKIVRFITIKQKVQKSFRNVPELNYAGQKQNLEDLVTAQMTYMMDGRLVKFYDHNRNDAKTLRDIIRKKQRFPRDEFLKLKEAFPCILAGIRDYAEYIPLEPEIFDLVIIDESSQVSIAQAFPALLRAKKILVLGDKKQFSNVKSAQARTDTNREYLNNLKNSFKKNVSEETTKLVRLNKFNIKTSILEFFEFITNYNTQLLKHFRGYKEIISYSNKYFYQDNLQVMKIRGKAIDDVLKFSFVEHDGKMELSQNTNAPEAEYIISELKKLKESDSNSSVGIITPHTNQQKLLMEMISKLPERDYFFDKLQLKIMTFDTCQGEERDIIFYSMVATEELDRLWGVFIKDLSSVDIEEDGKIKAQRLNVGFSRAKERIHIVLSKSLDKYNGSIGEALRHYQYVLDETKKEKSVSEVDEKSKMEPQVMNWFYQTKFWKENKDSIEFIPQFEIGKYLRQLDKTYNHPSYKVDFLLVYKDETHREHKIVIEYDGFREHFEDIDEINEFNYEHYYSDEDVYREKVLEGYGYKFLRINKFNIGDNPIETLDERIGKLVKKRKSGNKLLSSIHETIEGLQNGKMKECPKCKEVRNLDDFRDTSLITGYGRFCNHCKGIVKLVRADTKTKRAISGNIETDRICPRCGSNMILRSGRYGKFYGCSRFPYCRGTRRYNN